MVEEITFRGHHLRLLYGYMKAMPRNFSLGIKRSAIMKAAIENGHSEEHGQNIIKILEGSLKPGAKLKMVDTIDDICQTCNNKNKKVCVEFIPYGTSAACDDRGMLHHYGLQRRTYTTEFLQKRMDEIGENK